jgi:hypothetical protein
VNDRVEKGLNPKKTLILIRDIANQTKHHRIYLIPVRMFGRIFRKYLRLSGTVKSVKME